MMGFMIGELKPSNITVSLRFFDVLFFRFWGVYRWLEFKTQNLWGLVYCEQG